MAEPGGLPSVGSAKSWTRLKRLSSSRSSSSRGLKIKNKILKMKNDSQNIKNISRTFSGVVVGSVGSVHFWIVP